MTITQTEPRIVPQEPPYDPDTESSLARWMPPGSEVPPLSLFRTLAVHDELMSRMRPLGAGILGHGSRRSPGRLTFPANDRRGPALGAQPKGPPRGTRSSEIESGRDQPVRRSAAPWSCGSDPHESHA